MFGSNTLDVAIGMAFVYLLLSFVITAANELIAAILASRGNNLWKGIVNLLPEGFAQQVYDHPLVDGLSNARDRPSYIPSRTFVLALLDVISGSTGELPDLPTLKSKINGLPSRLKQPLLVMLSEASGDVEQFKTNVEVWFNNSMDRVSGWYKRKTQYVLLGIAALVTLLLNVDSLVLLNRLSQDTSLRAALVARAEAASKQTEELAARPAGTGSDDIKRAHDDLAAATAKLQELNLPTGWVSSAELQAAPDEDKAELTTRLLPGSLGDGWSLARSHFIGWLLTALAISLGAPFWFDILNKFVNIRSAGKSPEEKPKEPKEVPQPLAPGQPAGASSAPPADGSPSSGPS